MKTTTEGTSRLVLFVVVAVVAAVVIVASIRPWQRRNGGSSASASAPPPPPSPCCENASQQEVSSGRLAFDCPESFALASPSLVTLTKTNGTGSFCTLTLEGEGGVLIPVARSYDGHDWERSGGGFSSQLAEWTCHGNACSSVLPVGKKYILQDRSIVQPEHIKVSVARFLETATFGTTRHLLDTWSIRNLTFARFIQEQIEDEGPTFHREFFRRRANPETIFHKIEFAATLDPCEAEYSTWRRQALTVKDRLQNFTVRKLGPDKNDTTTTLWEVSINGHVRTITDSLRFVDISRLGDYDTRMPSDEQSDDRVKNIFSDRPPLRMDPGTYQVCSRHDETRRGIYKIRVGRRCLQLVAQDLLIDFPAGSEPENVLNGILPSLGDDISWQKISTYVPEFRKKGVIDASFCRGLPLPTVNGPGFFAKTVDGEWIQHVPRVKMEENTLKAPLPDGGARNLASGRVRGCSNVPRSFLNEEFCVLSQTPACPAGSANASLVQRGTVVCGSPGEVSNDPTLGDAWLDVRSITNPRTAQEIGLPQDTTPRNLFARQREFVWSEIALTANDQLRQRVAWALFYIFALPKTSVGAEMDNTEVWLQYYDIFVRNAFGNYRNILGEIAYNVMMSESLSYLRSRSVASVFNSTGSVIFPDENFARELMQLFTIGLEILNSDGTAILDANNNTIRTYDSDNIMSFASAWTGFVLQPKRANVESLGRSNRIDPLSLNPRLRDRFPKSDLYGGYLGDGYPLCVDLPEKAFLRVGAKYVLLGYSSKSELLDVESNEWSSSPIFRRRLQLEPGGSGLYELLCNGQTNATACTYPSVVVLDRNLACPQDSTRAPECTVDTVNVVQVQDIFYEYVRLPCTQHTFIEDAKKISQNSRWKSPMCANPNLPVAGSACCPLGTVAAQPFCSFPGERVTMASAQARCASRGMALCDYRFVGATRSCPHTGYHWTSVDCKIQAKIRDDGMIAVVHRPNTDPFPTVREDTPSFFSAYWKNGSYPTVQTGCGDGVCKEVDGTCLCDISVTHEAVFTSLPPTAESILGKLRVGHAGPKLFDDGSFATRKHSDYRYHSAGGSCCSQDTVFEVTDSMSGVTTFLRNYQSQVTVVGAPYSFRNPVQFNSLILSEFSMADAQHETDALLDHLFYHKNTPPFVATRLIQRFGTSNPSPRYVLTVAQAFRRGSFSMDGVSFGSGKYGDMASTIAAILLDRETRSSTLVNDPSKGSLREPILKVLAFMRAMEFNSTVPLVELNLMDEKVGQMAYEQPSVFSFFRPEYSPPGPTSTAMLVSPEAEVQSSGKVIGILNGLYSLVEFGLVWCKDGFGAFGGCSRESSSGELQYLPRDRTSSNMILEELSVLLTSGRLGESKRTEMKKVLSRYTDRRTAFQRALQLIATTPEFHATDSLSPEPEYAATAYDPVTPSDKPQETSSYKAVIHLALVGGCDSFNVLVPQSNCGQIRDEYDRLRDTIALNDTELLGLAGETMGQPCKKFAVHHRLSHINELYDDQDLLFVANVGVLNEQVNKTDYLLKTKTQLFAHNAMQEEINVLDPFKSVAGTGSLGRLADVLAEKGFITGRVAVSAPPDNLAGLSKKASPIVTLDQNGVTRFNEGKISSDMIEAILKLNTGKYNAFGELWSSILSRSLNQTEDLYEILFNTPTKTDFATTTPLGSRLKLIAQLIAAREARGVQRDFFFVPFSGFDSHASVIETLDRLFADMNEVLRDLSNELKAIGVWDDVVLVQTSDFGRTITPNTGGGSDHGWGGVSFLAGGNVSGSQVVGEYPPSFTGNLDLGRGRILPTTPWDSVFNAISNWMGLENDADLTAVLPNRARFDSLFTAEDLFV